MQTYPQEQRESLAKKAHFKILWIRSCFPQNVVIKLGLSLLQQPNKGMLLLTGTSMFSITYYIHLVLIHVLVYEHISRHNLFDSHLNGIY